MTDTSFGSGDVVGFVRRAADAMRAIEDEVSEADSRLGDGDTGIMLRRLLDIFGTAAAPSSSDVGQTFRSMAVAGSSATGSSLGTLIVVAFLELSNATAGKTEVPWTDLSLFLDRALKVMMARGKASLGDKTVLDSLAAIAAAISSASTMDEVKKSATTAARSTLVEFRTKPCRIGRARMFGDKSIGLDDPGQLAVARLLELLCA